MTLRCINIKFNKNVTIQSEKIGRSHPKLMRKDSNLTLVELGTIMSYGADHKVGVVSKDITNTVLVKNNIKELEGMAPGGRLKWFKINYPNAEIIKITSSLISNQLRKDKAGKKTASSIAPISINGAFDLTWDKLKQGDDDGGICARLGQD